MSPPSPADTDVGPPAEALAEEAGLTYATEESPGYRRVRRGKGFSYVAPDGEVAGEEERERIQSLAIPPAWADVWVAIEEDSHIQATGYDNAGRKQYVYHSRWEDIRDEVKFARMAPFGRRVADLRKSVDEHLRRPGLGPEKVVALAVAVLDRTLIRVGNRQYADDNEAYGLTTLRADHAEVNGRHVVLDFEGKGGAENQLVFEDKRLARMIGRCQELSGQTLFSYETPDGAASISSTDVNRYLASSMRERFTAKDFRTWGATTVVAQHLANGDGDQAAESRVTAAIDVAAEKLGNTRSVCRDSYVHPAIPAAFETGELEGAWKSSRTGRWVDRSESTVRRILDRHEGTTERT